MPLRLNGNSLHQHIQNVAVHHTKVNFIAVTVYELPYKLYTNCVDQINAGLKKIFLCPVTCWSFGVHCIKMQNLITKHGRASQHIVHSVNNIVKLKKNIYTDVPLHLFFTSNVQEEDKQLKK